MNAPALNIAPDATALLATIAKLDTLDQARLLADAWEQMLAQCDDDEHDQLSHVTLTAAYSRDFGISTFDALDYAWASLRDYRSAAL